VSRGPLYNDNRLKLGVFGINVSNGCAATTAEGHLKTSWPTNVDIATVADQAGFEAIVPVARWKGFGGKTNFNGSCFETYTWAAGLGAIIQKPYPAIMNAGMSPTGARFAAKYSDMLFTNISSGTNEEIKSRVAELRRMGRDEFGRHFQVWGSCSIVCRPAEKEAMDYARYYILEKGDWEAAANLARMGRPGKPPGPGEPLRSPGWGGYLVVGTPEQMVDALARLSSLGVDGVCSAG
jgi:alkanesulfonate monooxygenase SsuD/methylene tetrahydromethanopterin reductase-like flavin-dependent oxidoreductase (luciferase family)